MTNICILPDPEKELRTRNPLVVTVDAVLSPLECQELIVRIEAKAPGWSAGSKTWCAPT